MKVHGRPSLLETSTRGSVSDAPRERPSKTATTKAPAKSASGTAPVDEMARNSGAKAALRALALDVRSAPIEERPASAAQQAASLGERLMRFRRSETFRKGVAMAALGLTLVGCGRPSASQAVVAQTVDAGDTAGATRSALERPASSWLDGHASETDSSSTTFSPHEVLIASRVEANRTREGGGASTPSDADGALDSITVAHPGVAEADALRVAVPLSRGVGAGQPNREADVRVLQQRLVDLGFPLAIDGDMGPSTLRALRTFNALVEGKSSTRHASSHIKPESDLHRALERTDLPTWMEMPAEGIGFRNIDDDNHDYGWSVLADVIASVGQRYYDDYQCLHPDASPLLTNDASLRLGGDTPDHSSHETGLDLDLRLPNRSVVGQPTHVSASSYDRDTARAQVKALIAEPSVERVLIGDNVLLREFRASDDENAHKVQDGGRGHRDHIHVDVSFPELFT